MSDSSTASTNTLREIIEASLKDGKLIVDSNTLPSGQLREVFTQTIGTDTFIINNAVLQPNATSLLITGTAALHGIDSVTTQIISDNAPNGDLSFYFEIPPTHLNLSQWFTVGSESLLDVIPLDNITVGIICPGDTTLPPRIAMRGAVNSLKLENVSFEHEWGSEKFALRWSASDKLLLPGIEWLSIENINLNFNTTSSADDANGKLKATIQAGNFALPLAIALPADGQTLQLHGDFDVVALPSLSDISALLGSGQLLEKLPPAINNLDGFSLNRFELPINPHNGAIPYVSVGLSSSANWQLIPDVFALSNIGLQLNTFSPISDTRTFSGAVSGQINIAGVNISVGADIDDTLTFYGQIKHLDLAQLAQSLLPQNKISDALPSVSLHDIALSVSGDGNCTISCGNVHCELASLATALGVALPEALNNISLNQFSMVRDANAASWKLRVASNSSFAFAPGDHQGMQISQANIELLHDPTGNSINCHFVISGTITLSPEISIHFQNVEFNWQQAQNRWQVAGSVIATIVGTEYLLEAAIEIQGDSHTIVLKYPAELLLSDLGGAGSIVIGKLCVQSEKHVDGDETSHTWGVSGAARIIINHLCEVDGDISLQTSNEGKQLQLSAKAPVLPPIVLPIDLPQQPELHVALDDLAITYADDNGGKANWSLTSAAHLQIVNIPDVIKSYFPAEPLNGFLRADGKTTAIGFNVPSTLQPNFPELALTFANDFKLSLGKPEIAISAIELQLGEQPKLVQKISAGLPSQLNNIFGQEANGTPNLDLFNERFELSVTMAKKLALTLDTSPLKPLKFYQKNMEKDGDDGQWTLWDFGAVGKVEFRVPEFSFSGGRWNASCGFNRLTDIGLPLKPIKFLLEKCGFPNALTTVIPNALPLKDIDLSGDNFGREMKFLLGDDVLGRLDKDASRILDGLFDAVKGVIDRLPTHLQEYLQIRIPKSAVLEISVDSTGGGTSVALRTLKNDPPLKFLFPMMLGIPELMGVSLRGFSFGQTMGGSLALIEFDGHIDRLDMLSLTAALALDKQDISNRYILDKTLFALPTAFPLPIPIFFSKLGLDYRDVLGFEIQAHWSYPDPQLGVFEMISLFSDLMQFFKQPDYLLHEEGFGETLGLELTIGQNFISLPGYLGGQTLGLQKALPTLSVGDSVARFLDFLKTGNAGYAITAIPLQHDGVWIRIGSEEIHFGPLVIGMSWCITTDEEFVDTIIPKSKTNDSLPMQFDNAVLESLPTKDEDSSYSKGFIILLAGHANIGTIVGMRTEFGIAVTAQGGFETGFRITGEIGGALMLQISGTVQADQTSTTVKGSTGLYWKDQPLIASSGRVTVSETALEVEIVIELGPTFSIAGLLVIGNKGFLMSGKANWGHGAEGPSEGIGASIQFTADGMIIVFAWTLFSLNGEVRIRVPGDGQQQLFSAAVILKPNLALQEAFANNIKSVAKSAAENTVDQVYNDLQSALADIDSLEGSIAGLRQWLPPLCKSIIATINRSISANTRGWKKPGRKPAQRKARPYINRLKRLQDVAEKASDKTFRPKLKAALNAIIKYNKLSISYRIGWPVNKRFSIYSRNLMNSTQLGQLRTAIQWIDKLPAKDGVRIKAQNVYDQLPDRDKLLAEINRNISKGIDDAFPKIESMEFETSLGLVDAANLTATVVYHLGGNKHIATTPLDVTNPVKMSNQLRDAFGT